MKKMTWLLLLLSIVTLSACSNNTPDANSTKDLKYDEVVVEKLYGKWESEGEDETNYIEIKESDKGTVLYSDIPEDEESYQTLLIEEAVNTSISMLSEDESVRYTFGLMSDGKIVANFGINPDKKGNEGAVGLSKPITYHLVK